MIPATSMECRRASWFTGLLLLINVVGDGFSGRPNGLPHQLLVLPVTFAFLFCLYHLLKNSQPGSRDSLWSPKRALQVAFGFECATLALFFYECRHFAGLGYRLHPLATLLVFVPVLLVLGWLGICRGTKGCWIFVASTTSYAAVLLLSIGSFPLNYLRSDMLPVILWADTNLLRGLSPYQTIYIASKVYDFPYLPGMLVAYLPAVAAHIDLRFVSSVCVIGTAALVYFAARHDRRREVAALLALFLLCPFLQYRHELYNQPHWLTVAAALVLLQRRRFVWAGFVLGISMAVYQFSWIICPFVLLNGWRRRGVVEVAKLSAIAAAGALLILGPFLRSASARIASNTVSQWGLMKHASADPINLSYWATYVISPARLLPLQAVLLVVIFAYCVFTRRCATLVDTLRWSIVAMTAFILFNVLVDGYFYLMLLVPLLIYTCLANGWWSEPNSDAEPA